MPEYLSPGVYVEEVQTGPRPIEGVSTSTAAIIGPTERGPLAPRMVTSWLEYQRWYGGFLPDAQRSFVPYAVQGFFDNGGQRLFVARILDPEATTAEGDVADVPLRIRALGPGTWGNRIYYRIDRASKTNERPDYFRLTLLYYTDDDRIPPDDAQVVYPLDPKIEDAAVIANFREPDRVEDYDNLTHTPGAANNVITVVNAASQLVRVWWTGAPAPFPVPPAPPPDQVVPVFYVRLDTDASSGAALDGGFYEGVLDRNEDDAPDPTLFGQGRGLAALEAIDEINLLMAPDEVNPNVANASEITSDVITQCEKLKDRFAIVSVGAGQNAEAAVRPPRDSSYAGFYYPWIEIYDPVSRAPLQIPPSGHVAGIIARTDIERGVHKAPANEVVRGARRLEFPVTKGMQDMLNPRGVNCIRDFSSDGRGIRLWGARTMSSDPLWKYINVRRLFLFVEESIDEGTQWVVFEPNDEPLWAQVRRTITSFLIGIWRNGALMGLTQDEAFFVKCDRTTMTQDDIDNGRLVCYIGIAPVKPAEFVIFRISQKTVEAEG
jgi:phage tail sheath protein FI